MRVIIRLVSAVVFVALVANLAEAQQPLRQAGPVLPDPLMLGFAGVGENPVQQVAWQHFENHSLGVVPISYDEPVQHHDSKKCAACYSDPCCCAPPWAHRTAVFGEFLFLRAADAEVEFAVPANGNIGPGAPTVRVGPTAVADPGHDPGFRGGFSYCLSDTASIVSTFTLYQSHSFSDTGIISPAPNRVVRSFVLHPSTTNAAADFFRASANIDIDFDLIDLSYRQNWWASDVGALNYLLGVRYARLDQDFTARFERTGIIDTLTTDVNFDGVGFNLGLDGERHSHNSGLFVYGRTMASFLSGEFRARYTQTASNSPSPIVDTTWDANRIVSLLEIELGAGWQSPCGRFRLTGGYMINAWYNSVVTDEWIDAIRADDTTGMNSLLTFDGLTARAEVRF